MAEAAVNDGDASPSSQPVRTDEPVRTHRVRRDDVDIHVVEHGQPDGVPVVMLHGWPDSHRLWRHQVPALVSAGHRVIAPDQRGFGQSSRPEGADAYRMRELLADLTTVMDTLDVATAHVVGHDWGASVAWAMAAFKADRVRTLTALAVGHPASAGYATIRQRQLSWYMLAFQFEGLAEDWLRADDWANFQRMVGEHPEAGRWVADLSRPGALTASLNWYRANLPAERLLGGPSSMPEVSVPTLGISGGRDFALGTEQMEGSAALVRAEWRHEHLPDSGHWLPLDQSEVINDLLTDWIRR